MNRSSRRWRLPALLLSAALACTSPAQAAEYLDAIKAATQADTPSEKAFYQELANIHAKLSAVSGLKLRLLVSDDDDVNAYATEAKGEKVVVLHWGLLEALHEDRDALAAVMAHEFAHHGKDHIAKGKSADGFLSVLGALAGAVVDYKLGTSRVGSSLGQGGAKMLSRTYSRDQEREADSQGVEWMVAAGYNPLGAVRLQQKLTQLAGGDDKFSLFRTHPPSKERAADLQALVQKLPGAQALTGQPIVALALPDDDEADNAKLASAPAGAGGRSLVAPKAESLTPIRGFDLARYAALVNEVGAAGDAGAKAVLAKAGLDDAAFTRLNNDWVDRMRTDPALSGEYGMVYLEQSVGPLAAHGRAVAAAQRGRAKLGGDPPLSEADWLSLYRAQMALYADGKDYKAAALQIEALAQAKGLRAYDFQVANWWWMTMAQQRAGAGDTSLVQKMSAR
jgi:predicted Zn-dependent protease